MNTTKNIFIIIGLLALVGGASMVFSHKSPTMMEKDSMMKKDDGAMMMEKDKAMTEKSTMEKDTMIKEDSAMMKKDEGVMMTRKGAYGMYSGESSFMAAKDSKLVLFFHAPWCPACASLDKELSAGVMDGFTVLKVDYDTAMDLKKKYGVTVQHTFVQTDAQGILLKKWSDGSIKTVYTQAQ